MFVYISRQQQNLWMSQQTCLLLLLLPSIPWARILHKNPQPKSSFSRTSLLTKTNAATEDSLDVLVAKFFYSCNIPFTVSDHPGFSVGLSLIVSDELKSQMKYHLKDQTVTLVEDGWSNIRNEPILAITVQKRFKPSSHLVAYLLHPDYRGSRLINEQRELAHQWLIENNSDYLPAAIVLKQSLRHSHHPLKQVLCIQHCGGKFHCTQLVRHPCATFGITHTKLIID